MIEEYVNIIDKIIAENIKITNELSEIDIDLNDITHIFEYIKMDAITLSKYVKLYKTLLIRRRDIKEQRILLTTVTANNPKLFNERYDEYKNRYDERNSKYTKESLESHKRITTKYLTKYREGSVYDN